MACVEEVYFLSRKIKIAVLSIVFQSLFFNLAFGLSSIDKTNYLLKGQIKKLYHCDEVTLIGSIKWLRGDILASVDEVTVLNDDSNGSIHFTVMDKVAGNSSEGSVSFSAWILAKVAVRRIYPGELLSLDAFISKKIDLSVGLGHEYRGDIVQANIELKNLESIQTIIEGQFLVKSAIRKTPDIRRGDSVRIHLISGDLTLATVGIAEESGYLSHQIRVMTRKEKRQLLGLLRSGHVVEVPL